MADQKYLRDDVPFCIAHLVEELGEALAAAGKSLRWGLDSVNPELPPEQRETNWDWLMREMNDVSEAMGRLHAARIRERTRKQLAQIDQGSPQTGNEDGEGQRIC